MIKIKKLTIENTFKLLFVLIELYFGIVARYFIPRYIPLISIKLSSFLVFNSIPIQDPKMQNFISLTAFILSFTVGGLAVFGICKLFAYVFVKTGMLQDYKLLYVPLLSLFAILLLLSYVAFAKGNTITSWGVSIYLWTSISYLGALFFNYLSKTNVKVPYS